jgi:excisionase family DNA binding protein
MAERPYTVAGAAEQLGCSAETVRKLCKAGRLRNFRIGVGDKAYFRITAAALEEYRCGSSGSAEGGTPTNASTDEQSERAWGPRLVRLQPDD